MRYRACSRDENHDRRRYYRQIPGNDSEKDLYKKSLQTSHNSKSRSRSRDAHSKLHCGGTQRCRHNHSSDRNLNSKPPQSACDQSFQETMVLRLRELQRNTEKLARRANGDDDLDNDNDDMESLSSGSTSSESEYSGADDGNVMRSADPGVSRLYQPISDRDMEALGEGSEQSVLYRHNQSMRSTSSGRIIESTSVVHRSESTITKDKSKTRKRRKRRLKNSGDVIVSNAAGVTSSSSNHGYLRANAIKSGAICSLPTTTMSSTQNATPSRSLVSKSLTVGDSPATNTTAKSSVIRHQHEHIHHHYYYPCKPDT